MKKKRGTLGILFDIVFGILTGGLWWVWIFIRFLRNNSQEAIMYLKLLPVCQCGKVLPELKIETSIREVLGLPGKPLLTKVYSLTPDKCPSCGEKIEGIISQFPAHF